MFCCISVLRESRRARSVRARLNTPLRTAVVALLLIGGCAACWCADAKAPAKPAEAPPKPAAKAKPKPKKVLRTDAEISGLTSEITDQFYTRLNLQQTGGPTNWFVRTSYAITKSRSYSGNNVYESQVDTLRVDSQYRANRRERYRFVSATANLRTRSPYTVTYGTRSGYYLMSAGVGTTVLPGLESEIGLAGVGTYGDEIERSITLVSSLRWRNELTDAMALSGHAYLVRPFANNMLVDSRMDLTYAFTPSPSLRFSYVANNLLKPITSRTGWDRSFRVSVVFSHTTR